MSAIIATNETLMAEQVIPILIGILAGLVGWVVNQLVVKRWESFRSEN